MRRARDRAKEKADSCQQCVQEQCEAKMQKCELDFACNFNARCRLKTSPSEYQACLQDQYKVGLTVGDERRFPWEGLPWEGQEDNPFIACLYAHCRDACTDKPFACDEKGQEYQDLQLKVAVRVYPGNEPLRQASLSLCDDKPDVAIGEDAGTCKPSRTDDEGIASFEIDFISAKGLYFDIAGKGSPFPFPFPRTLYYPGRLGYPDRLGKKASPRQNEPRLLAIYVLSDQLIQSGNNLLGRKYKVLQDAGQSVVLTDSCVWDEIAAPGLRVHVDKIEQCNGLSQLCDDAGCPPCVWYAVGDVPDRYAKLTNGKGAGIVGLPEGFYTIRVFHDGGPDEQQTEVSRRERIRMENGAMTIVRTWPDR